MIAEPSPQRQRAMAVLTLIGAGVALVMLHSLLYDTVSAQVQGHCIRYGTQLHDGGRLTVLYVVATCGVLLLSSARRIVAFGVANLVVVVLLGWLMTYAFISLWCAWAAITSVVIDLHLRSKARGHPGDPQRGPPVGARSAGYSP